MSGFNIECSSTVTAERDDVLNAALVKAWIANLPDGATLTAIIRDHGTQRDPVPTLVGLKAAWSEVRHP